MIRFSGTPYIYNMLPLFQCKAIVAACKTRMPAAYHMTCRFALPNRPRKVYCPGLFGPHIQETGHPSNMIST